MDLKDKVLALTAVFCLFPWSVAKADRLDLECPEGREILFECTSVREVKKARIKLLGLVRTKQDFRDSYLCGVEGIFREEEPVSMNLFTRHLWFDFRDIHEDRKVHFETESYFIATVDGFFDPGVSNTKLHFSHDNTSYQKSDSLEVRIDKEEGTVDFRLRLDRKFYFFYEQELRIVYEDCFFQP